MCFHAKHLLLLSSCQCHFLMTSCLRATSLFKLWQKNHQTLAVPVKFIHQFLSPWIMNFFTFLEIWKSLSLDKTGTWTLSYDRGRLLGSLKITHLCLSCASPHLLQKGISNQNISRHPNLAFLFHGWMSWLPAFRETHNESMPLASYAQEANLIIYGTSFQVSCFSLY